MNQIKHLGLGILLFCVGYVVVLGPASKIVFADDPTTQATSTATPTPTPDTSTSNTITPTPTATIAPISTPTPSDTPAVTPTPTATATPTPTASPTSTPSPSVTINPTATPTPTITTDPTATPTSTVTPTPTSTPTATPTPTQTPIQSHPIVDFPNVVVNQTYTAPQSSGVKVKFTNLPSASGDLTFSTVNTGSGTGYQITSSMANGSFTYDLTLPLPAGATNYVVKYSPTSDLSNAQVVTESITNNGDGTITVHGLNHFTVFVVDTNPSSVACVGAGSNCYTTIQGAVDAAANGDTINVQAGTYNETVNVTKQLTINGSGVPTVTKFIVWVSNVTISGINTTTVNAQPSVSLTNPIKNSNKTNVTISGSGLANANVHYTITDSGSAHSLTGTGTVSAGGTINISGIDLSSFNDGSINLSVTLDDGAGHSSSAATASSFKDTTSPATPSVSMTNPINNSNKTSVSFSGTGEAGTTAQYTISDGVHTSITGTLTVSSSGSFSLSNINVSGLNDGTLTLSVNLTDSVGNTSSNATYNSTKDTVAPTVSAGSNVAKKTQFTTSSTVSDTTPSSGIASYSWTYSGPGTITFGSASSQNTTISANTDGAYTITLTVADNAGNSTSNSFTLNWDTAVPNVNAGSNATTSSTLNRTATASDPTPSSGALTYQWSYITTVGTGTVNFGSANSLTTTIVPTADGTYTITLTATDPAGNSNSSSFTYVYDTTAPTISNGTTKITNSQFTTTQTASDPTPSSGALTYQWTQTSGTGTITFGSANSLNTTVSTNTDGVYTFTFTATDPVGNSSTTTYNLTWDTTRPALSSDNVIAGWYTSNPTITLSVSDALSGLNNVRYAWDSTADASTGTAFTNGVTINIPSDGTHTLNLYAYDNAGNTQTFSATYRLDTVNPTVSATGSSASWQTTLPSIVINGSDTMPGSGVASITYQWDSGSIVTVTNATDIASSFPGDGTHTLNLVITDVAGRTNTFSGTYKIDRVIPSTTDNVDGLWHNSTVTVTLTCTDITSGCNKVFYTTDGSTPTTSSAALNYVGGTASFQISSEGTFTVKYFSQDVAGNNENVRSSALVKIDLTAPNTASITLTNNTTGNNTYIKNGDSVTLSAVITDNNQSLLATSMITADLSTLGGGSAVHPVSYNSTTGVATWAAITVSGTGNGLFTAITLSVVDVAGNTGLGQQTLNDIADNTKPSTTDNAPSGWHNGTVTVTLNCFDINGCAATYYTTNGATPTTSSQQGTSIVLSANGTFTIKYFSVDVAGNAEPVQTATNQVMIDISNPVISGVILTNTTTGNNTYVKNGDTVVLTATITDNNQALITTSMIFANLSALGGGTSVNPTSYNPTTGAATWAGIIASGTGNGTVTVTVDASDIAGNSASQQSASMTADNVAPVISAVNITTSNSNSSFARAGNVITVTFTSSETIVTPTVTIAGHNVIPTNIGNNWTAIYTMVAADAQGAIVYSISNIADLAGNTASTINNTSTITFDSIAPTLPSVTLATSNANSTRAKAGDTVTLTFTSSEQIQTPVVTIAGHAVTAVNTAGNTWQATYPFVAIDTQGAINYAINFQDLAGNTNSQNTNSTIIFDSIAPTLPSVNMASNAQPSDTARAGDKVTVAFSSSEAIQNVSVYIDGRAATVVSVSSTSWAASRVTDGQDHDGNFRVLIYYQDLAGNLGIAVTSTTDGSGVHFTGAPSQSSGSNGAGSSSSSGGSSGSSGAPTASNPTPASSTPASIAKAVAEGQTGSAVLSWPKVPGATGYALVFGTSPDKLIYGASFIGNGDATSFKVGFLKPGANYYFKIIALGVKGNNIAAVLNLRGGASVAPSVVQNILKSVVKPAEASGNTGGSNINEPINQAPVNFVPAKPVQQENSVPVAQPVTQNKPGIVQTIFSTIFQTISKLFNR